MRDDLIQSRTAIYRSIPQPNSITTGLRSSMSSSNANTSRNGPTVIARMRRIRLSIPQVSSSSLPLAIEQKAKCATSQKTQPQIISEYCVLGAVRRDGNRPSILNSGRTINNLVTNLGSVTHNLVRGSSLIGSKSSTGVWSDRSVWSGARGSLPSPKAKLSQFPPDLGTISRIVECSDSTNRGNGVGMPISKMRLAV